jgi:hypothetical protein
MGSLPSQPSGSRKQRSFPDGGSNRPKAALRGISTVRIHVLATTLSLKEKLIESGAKLVSHGYHVAFQMAEVAIPRNLFADILRLIVELRPPPVTSTA